MKPLSLVTAITLLLSISSSLSAQTSLTFSLLDQQILDSSHRNATFGGISAIETIPAKVFGGDNSKESMILFSDHTDAGHKPARDWGTTTSPRSYLFSLLNGKDVSGGTLLFDLNNVECVRYSKPLKRLYYSYESDYETGIGFVPDTGRNRSATLILQQHCPFQNRGIEGIALGADASLWYALESGDADSDSFTSLVRIPFNNGMYNAAAKEVFQYPFDRSACLRRKPSREFGASLGGGVSEILDMPERLGGGLLVLERCWDDSAAFARLYIARTEKGSQVVTKELAFDFNGVLQPDNLEGMAWGPDQNGAPVLYIVSDDNYRWTGTKPQKTQLIRLKVKTKS